MTYEEWNEKLVEHFFHLGLGNSETLLLVDRGLLAELCGADEEDALGDFLRAIVDKTGENPLCEPCAATRDLARYFDVHSDASPPFLAFLSLYVLAWTTELPEDQGLRINNYYTGRLNPLLEMGGLTYANVGTQEFKRTHNAWLNLQHWTEYIDNRGHFTKRTLGSDSHIGVPLSQALFTARDRVGLAECFKKNKLVPGYHYAADVPISILSREINDVCSSRTANFFWKGDDEKKAMAVAFLDILSRWDGSTGQDWRGGHNRKGKYILLASLVASYTGWKAGFRVYRPDGWAGDEELDITVKTPGNPELAILYAKIQHGDWSDFLSDASGKNWFPHDTNAIDSVDIVDGENKATCIYHDRDVRILLSNSLLGGFVEAASISPQQPCHLLAKTPSTTTTDTPDLITKLASSNNTISHNEDFDIDGYSLWEVSQGLSQKEIQSLGLFAQGVESLRIQLLGGCRIISRRHEYALFAPPTALVPVGTTKVTWMLDEQDMGDLEIPAYIATIPRKKLKDDCQVEITAHQLGKSPSIKFYVRPCRMVELENSEWPTEGTDYLYPEENIEIRFYGAKPIQNGDTYEFFLEQQAEGVQINSTISGISVHFGEKDLILDHNEKLYSIPEQAKATTKTLRVKWLGYTWFTKDVVIRERPKYKLQAFPATCVTDYKEFIFITPDDGTTCKIALGCPHESGLSCKILDSENQFKGGQSATVQVSYHGNPIDKCVVQFLPPPTIISELCADNCLQDTIYETSNPPAINVLCEGASTFQDLIELHCGDYKLDRAPNENGNLRFGFPGGRNYTGDNLSFSFRAGEAEFGDGGLPAISFYRKPELSLELIGQVNANGEVYVGSSCSAKIVGNFEAVATQCNIKFNRNLISLNSTSEVSLDSLRVGEQTVELEWMGKIIAVLNFHVVERPWLEFVVHGQNVGHSLYLCDPPPFILQCDYFNSSCIEVNNVKLDFKDGKACIPVTGATHITMANVRVMSGNVCICSGKINMLSRGWFWINKDLTLISDWDNLPVKWEPCWAIHKVDRRNWVACKIKEWKETSEILSKLRPASDGKLQKKQANRVSNIQKKFIEFYPPESSKEWGK